MFKVEKINEEIVTDFFLNDPKLCLLGLDDYRLVLLYESKIWKADPYSSLFGIYNDKNELISVFKYEYYTAIAVNAHIYVASKYHYKGISLGCCKEGIKYIKETTEASKIIVTVPASCKHVHKIAKKVGLKEEGRLKDTIVWRKEKTDLILYGIEI